MMKPSSDGYSVLDSPAFIESGLPKVIVKFLAQRT